MNVTQSSSSSLRRYTLGTKRLIFSLLLCISIRVLLACDEPIVFQSGTSGIKNNSFVSPNWPDSYPQDNRCTYHFIAQPHERVLLQIKHFNVEGISARCRKDFVDIYIEMKSKEDQLMDSKLLGRYCGHSLQNVPNTLVSLHNQIVLDFFADSNTQQTYNRDNHMGKLGFHGTFQFIPRDDLAYLVDSNPSSSCTYEIEHSKVETGYISSPTYPGIYPNQMNCIYYFRAKLNARIKLEFLEIDLYKKYSSCPLDYLLIYDGPSMESPLVMKPLCGKHKNMIVFSSDSHLTLIFQTGEERGDDITSSVRGEIKAMQNSGFRLRFTFSRNFIPVSLLNREYHIRGTECDIWIKSQGKSSGILSSPGFPYRFFPPNKICTFYLYGINNAQEKEIVSLNFSDFNLPSSSEQRPGSPICNNGHLSVHFIQIHYDKLKVEPPVLKMELEPTWSGCGKSLPPPIKSGNSFIVLRLNSSIQSNTQKAGYLGFKATYSFKKDFGIQGHMLEEGICSFEYRSSSYRKGFINSPFFDRHYPNNSSCRYNFIIGPHENIRIVFEKLHTAESPRNSADSSHRVHPICKKDYVQLSEIQPVLSNGNFHFKEKMTLTYCGLVTPGPLISERISTNLVILFVSDRKRTATGFRASYEYIPKYPLFSDCGANLTSPQRGGVFTSPKFPLRYTQNLNCEWHVYPTEPDNHLMLQFNILQIEGSPNSCAHAILRIYEEGRVTPSSELCGTDSTTPEYHTNSTFIRIRFLTTDKAGGDIGFKIVWTELLPRTDKGVCQGFQCQYTRHCIDYRMECNNLDNCGTYKQSGIGVIKDDSDEVRNCPVEVNYNLLQVGLGIILTVIFLCIVVVCILYREHKRSSQPIKIIHEPYMQSPTKNVMLLSNNRLTLIPNDENSINDGVCLTSQQCLQYDEFSDQEHTRHNTREYLVREKLQKISIV